MEKRKERSDVTAIRYTVAVYLCRSFSGRVLRHPFKYVHRRCLLRMTKAEASGRKVRSTPGDNACEHRCSGKRRNALQVTELQGNCESRPELLG